jgi:hypothetical protein
MITLVKHSPSVRQLPPSHNVAVPAAAPLPSPSRTLEGCYARLVPDQRTRVATVFAGMIMQWAPFSPAGAFISVAQRDPTLAQLAGRDLSMISARDLARLHGYVRDHYPDLFAQIMARPAVREILGDCAR